MRINPLTAGILFMLGASFFFSLMNGFVKLLSQHGIPTMENVFFRSFVMVVIMLLIYFYNATHHKPKKLTKKGGWGKLFVRLFMGGTSMLAVFYCIAVMPLGTATAFAQSSPIYAVIMGMLFLGEKVKFSIVCATLIGFVGLLLISDPNFNHLSSIDIAVGIFSGVSMAIAFVSLRSLKQYFSNSFLVLAFGLSTTLFGFFGLFVPIEGVGGFVIPNWFEWLLIFGTGASGTIAQFLLNKAYMSAPVGVVAPIDYTRILFGILIGILLGDSMPNFITLLGITLIIFAGVLIAAPALMKDLRKIKT